MVQSSRVQFYIEQYEKLRKFSIASSEKRVNRYSIFLLSKFEIWFFPQFFSTRLNAVRNFVAEHMYYYL